MTITGHSKLSEFITLLGDGTLNDALNYLTKDYDKEKEQKKTPIDLSVLIESGIDCEFTDEDTFTGYELIGKLTGIDDTNLPYSVITPHRDEDSVKYCRPRMSPHIHACPDGYDDGCPVPEGFKVNYYMRDCAHKGQGNKEASALRWTHARNLLEDSEESNWDDSDIIAFEVTGIADGWKL